MTRLDPAPARQDPFRWDARANQAAQSVTALFGRRLFFLPGTHLGAVTWPSPAWRRDPKGVLAGPWHYWWQAHYIDCLVDAGRRELGSGATPAARFNGPGHPSAGRLASRLVTGIRLRNAFTFVNNYYDDMAWLALATHRLDALAGEARRRGRRRNARVRRSLTLQFEAACTDDLNGGAFWSKKRDFKNTPASAPIALHFARTGHPQKARALLDWLDATLFDPDQGLYLDGARLGPAGEVLVERAVYTYNQGPVLGALLEMGGEADLARAAVVVDAVDRLLTVRSATGTETSSGGRVLRCEGPGDGGLFTGILCRYLALAAADGRLPAQTRATAARLVAATAEAFWSGKRTMQAGEAAETYRGAVVFSQHAVKPAGETYPPGAAVELSTQLQAWMVLEAAATLPGNAGN
ncbi:glycoside hydrolase family 76 protein [Arthrobacter sp. OY3WO11]|uniref:glycoside hydrolase family 76 protein n=1 Tax=Arthrobacter sp. OY3WO11 TaxID=1835723 RepID=UPI0007D01194|nr:glycoside hydrolase family 76 protein [Arthrobacter sp. OY3WO11]OAE00697.1 glycosyl hydrolase [Arthrobacter sp. OY3WO11]